MCASSVANVPVFIAGIIRYVSSANLMIRLLPSTGRKFDAATEPGPCHWNDKLKHFRYISLHIIVIIIVIIVESRALSRSDLALPFPIKHPSYGDCLKVKREYYQNSSVLDCVTQCSQSAAHLYVQFSQVKQIWFVSLGPLRCA